MKRGQKAIVTIPPEIGYGDKGLPGMVPPKAVLYFDMEIIDWKL